MRELDQILEEHPITNEQYIDNKRLIEVKYLPNF
jgi:hypothetical protein